MANSVSRMRLVFSAAALAALLGVALAPASRADEASEKLYKTKCAMCHGPDGKGQTPAGKSTGARDFNSDEVKKASDDALATIISDGKAKMPSYKKTLKPEEIKGLVAYIRSLAK